MCVNVTKFYFPVSKKKFNLWFDLTAIEMLEFNTK